MFKNSKLSRYKAGKIIECFCIDIDATKTALLLKLNRKTVNRYFLAFRRLIYLHQVSQKEQILGVVEVDESFFAPAGFAGAPAPAKGAGARSSSRFSASMSVTARFALNWSLIARPRRSRPSSGARFPLKALSIPTAGRATTDWWTLGSTNIFVSINPNTLRKNRFISMVLRPFGALQNAVWQSLMA